MRNPPWPCRYGGRTEIESEARSSVGRKRASQERHVPLIPPTGRGILRPLVYTWGAGVKASARIRSGRSSFCGQNPPAYRCGSRSGRRKRRLPCRTLLRRHATDENNLYRISSLPPQEGAKAPIGPYRISARILLSCVLVFFRVPQIFFTSLV
jgi:hypothetical protein